MNIFGESAVASASIAMRWNGELIIRLRLCGGVKAGTKKIRSRAKALDTVSATARWPK
jgi:hypothetical protein